MGTSNVRKGITQAHFNEQQLGIIAIEIFIIASFTGWQYKDWYVFGGVFLGLIIAMYIPIINILLALVLSIGWGGIGYFLGNLLSQDAAYVIGGLALLAGLGVHIAAIEWVRDIADTKDRNIL
jgi:hypothetical protein